MGRAFPIFQPKIDAPYPSDMYIKVFLPAPTFCLQFEKCMIHKWKKPKISLGRKKSKIKKTKCMTLIKIKRKQQIIIFMHTSLSTNLCIFYSLRSEEKLVVQLICSSFRRIATSGIRNSSVATGSIS